jgi:hypothetical protein
VDVMRAMMLAGSDLHGAELSASAGAWQGRGARDAPTLTAQGSPDMVRPHDEPPRAQQLVLVVA